MACKFACAMVEVSEQYKERRQLFEIFARCEEPVFVRRSVLQQAMGAADRLGTRVGRLVAMEPRFRSAAVKAAVRRRVGREWWAQTEGMSTLRLLRMLRENGVRPCEALFEEVCRGRVAGDATAPVLEVLCDVSRISPAVRDRLRGHRGGAPGLA